MIRLALTDTRIDDALGQARSTGSARLPGNVFLISAGDDRYRFQAAGDDGNPPGGAALPPTETDPGTATLAGACQPGFGGHETCAPRAGWLLKGYMAVAADPKALLDPHAAPALFGAGVAQALAIRWWLKAFGLTTEEHGPAGTRTIPTPKARWLFGDPHDLDSLDGADPWLEDPASLHILHWWLLSPPCLAPSWWVTFHATSSPRLDTGNLEEQVLDEARRAKWKKQPSRAAVQRDISCLIQMYGTRDDPAENVEESLSMQFRQLGLLTRQPGAGGGRRWRLDGGPPPAPEIVTYACLDYAAQGGAGAGSITLGRLAYEPGGPGRAFRLSASGIREALTAAGRTCPGITVIESIGYSSLVLPPDPVAVAWSILDSYYGRRPPVPPPGRRRDAARRPGQPWQPARRSTDPRAGRMQSRLF